MFKGEISRGNENLDILSDELERQAEIYKGLGVSKDVVMRLLSPRPNYLPDELRIPVVTLGKSVDLNQQASFAGVELFFDLSLAHDIANGITYPNPHLVWMQDGSSSKGKNVQWVRSHVAQNERPSTLADGIALALVHPNIHAVLKDHAISLPGSSVEGTNAPFLFVWYGGLELYKGNIDLTGPGWGSATSGN